MRRRSFLLALVTLPVACALPVQGLTSPLRRPLALGSVYGPANRATVLGSSHAAPE